MTFTVSLFNDIHLHEPPLQATSNPLPRIRNQALNQYGGIEFLVECDYDPKLLNLDNLPEFYHTILNYWHDFRRLTCDKQIPIKKTNNLEQP